MGGQKSNFRYCWGGVVVIICAGAICLASLGFGWLTTRDLKMIEVKGLAEHVVRADIGTLSINISNEIEEPTDISLGKKQQIIENLNKKREEDLQHVKNFLKEHGITAKEIVSESSYIYENNESVSRETYKRYLKATDTINVRTNDVDKILPIKKEIGTLLGKGVILTCDFSYKLSNFIDLKLKLMKDASENARKNAEAFVEPQNAEIGDLIFLKQGEVSINAEDDGAGGSYSSESESINKKLRLVVRAGYSRKCKVKH